MTKQEISIKMKEDGIASPELAKEEGNLLRVADSGGYILYSKFTEKRTTLAKEAIVLEDLILLKSMAGRDIKFYTKDLQNSTRWLEADSFKVEESFISIKERGEEFYYGKNLKDFKVL